MKLFIAPFRLLLEKCWMHNRLRALFFFLPSFIHSSDAQLITDPQYRICIMPMHVIQYINRFFLDCQPHSRDECICLVWLFGVCIQLPFCFFIPFALECACAFESSHHFRPFLPFIFLFSFSICVTN